MLVRSYEVAFTYRCNLRCHWCNRLVGVINIPDSDITPEEVRLAGGRLKTAGVTAIEKVKLSGGQPTLNPLFADVCKALDEHWPTRTLQLLTNATEPFRWPDGLRAKTRIAESRVEKVKPLHKPFTVSPADLGVRYDGVGVDRKCFNMSMCGRFFDKFGFNFCPFAGIIGRVVGVDSYSADPVFLGHPDICRHCMYGLRPVRRARLERRVADGSVPEVTKTFREGIDRWKASPFPIKRFVERL